MAWLYWGEIAEGAARAVGEEARHAVRVARVRVGERVSIGDGAGTVAIGPVTVAGDTLEIAVEEMRIEEAPVLEFWLVQALAKGGRDESAVQAATELGVSGIVPWSAERSVSRWDGTKAERGRARWRSIAREAAKQSVRARIPEVAPLASAADLARLPGTILTLEPTAADRLSSVDLPTEGRITVVVGPEGGMTPGELDALTAGGAVPIRLGTEVLRTSTAGPAALAALQVRAGLW